MPEKVFRGVLVHNFKITVTDMDDDGGRKFMVHSCKTILFSLMDGIPDKEFRYTASHVSRCEGF